MSAEPVCQVLEWDSAFFGYRVARVRLARLDEASVASILAWCEAEAIDWLYFLADANHRETPWLAHAVGLHQPAGGGGGHARTGHWVTADAGRPGLARAARRRAGQPGDAGPQRRRPARLPAPRLRHPGGLALVSPVVFPMTITIPFNRPSLA